MPMAIIMNELLPPWMSFYEHKIFFNPKIDSISKKALTKLRRRKWSKEKFFAFNQYQIEFKNQIATLKSNLDDVFEKMWRIKYFLDVSKDENPKSDDSNDEEEG